VERWFHLETILALPVPVVTLGDASDAVHQYPTGVAFREHSARLPRGRGALHRLVRDPRPDRTAGLLGDDRRLSAAEGRSYFAVNTLRPHQAVMIRYLHLCRDQARAPSPVKEKTALVLDRRSALLTIPDALAGLRDGHCSSSDFAVALRASEITGLQTCQIVRHSEWRRALSPWRKLDQDLRGTKVDCRSVAPISARSMHSTPGSRPRRSTQRSGLSRRRGRVGRGDQALSKRGSMLAPRSLRIKSGRL